MSKPAVFDAFPIYRDAVAEEFGVSVDDIRGQSRRNGVSQARYVLAWLLHRWTDAELIDIAVRLDRTKPVVSRSVKQVSTWRKHNFPFRNQIDRLVERCAARLAASQEGEA